MDFFKIIDITPSPIHRRFVVGLKLSFYQPPQNAISCMKRKFYPTLYCIFLPDVVK
nr:MAG TPA: hypothetical protein [Caudoviricetes sp.]